MSGRTRLGRGSRARPTDDDQGMETLQAEIALLREENARLKADEHQLPGLGTLLAHARALPSAIDGRAETTDEAAEMLVETMVIRQALLDACAQIELSMAAVKTKLDGLGTPQSWSSPGVNGVNGVNGEAG
jgi:uncharacterized protein YhdP